MIEIKDIVEITHALEILERDVENGKIDSRIDLTQYPGFEGISRTINKILDSYQRPLQDIHKVIGCLSSNDFSASMASDYKGEFKGLADSTNLVRTRMLSTQDAFQRISVGNFDRLDELKKVGRRSENDHLVPSIVATMETLTAYIAEMEHMSKEHNAGDIDVRMPANKFQGAYRTMAESVNTMVEGHIEVKKKAMACVAEFGHGNFNAPLERFPGKKAFINDTIEQVRSNLKALIADTEMLCQAAIDGRITTRADASKHPGDFGKIVKGVNDTLDTMVGFLDNMPAPAMAINKDFEIIYMNKVGASLGNSTGAQLVKEKRKCYDFFKTGDCKTSKCACFQAMEKNVTTTSETDAHTGALNLEIQYSGVPIHDAQGKVIGAFEVVTDQTATKLAQRLGKKVNDYQVKSVAQLTDVLQQLAQGDLTAAVELEEADADTQKAYDEFHAIHMAVRQFKLSVTELLKEVNKSSEMVSSTSQELASSSEEMNASTEQVSSAIQQISKGAQDQAAQIDETAKIMASVAKTVEESEVRSMKASEGARATSQRANAGVTTVESTIKKMQEIQKVVVESAKVIESLGKRSEEIGEIVDVITNISDQTNLLALNAAIEAARAGEQGRGFAVVAEEVKNLAEDSREAAERIAKMIKEVQGETAKAVEAMQRGTKETAEGMEHVEVTGKAFREISQMASSFEETMNAFAVEMKSQKDGATRRPRPSTALPAWQRRRHRQPRNRPPRPKN